MKPPLNWPALIVLAVILVLGLIGVVAAVHEIPATSHDIVLAIVSGLVGALSMKAADGAIAALTPRPAPEPKQPEA